nr:hypothetical protein [Peribacillus butanolivorans]
MNMFDWGTPGMEDKNLKLDDYIMDYIPRAVRKPFGNRMRRKCPFWDTA